MKALLEKVLNLNEYRLYTGETELEAIWSVGAAELVIDRQNDRNTITNCVVNKNTMLY